MKQDTCSKYAPEWFAGHWRDWHRGHGCNLDDGKPRSPAAEIVISQHAKYRVVGALTDAEIRELRVATDRLRCEDAAAATVPSDKRPTHGFLRMLVVMHIAVTLTIWITTGKTTGWLYAVPLVALIAGTLGAWIWSLGKQRT